MMPGFEYRSFYNTHSPLTIVNLGGVYISWLRCDVARGKDKNTKLHQETSLVYPTGALASSHTTRTVKNAGLCYQQGKLCVYIRWYLR